jgi:hypothetical protein
MWRRSIGGHLTALLPSAVASLGLVPSGGAEAGTRAATLASGVLFRPVLCAVPPYDKFVTSTQPPLSPASCGPSSLTSGALAVTPSSHSASGYTYQTPQPAIILEGEHTTTPARDVASKVVLLGGLPGSSVYAATPTSKAMRYLLGPAVMTSRAIASASATKKGRRWVVDWTTTAVGAVLWDRVTRASFHRLLALDVGGMVVTAPIIEPTQTAFTPFRGHGEVTGNWSQAEATRIAAALQPGG